jgi:hypothetical protein
MSILTRDDARAEILATLNYESDVTGALCQRFIAACRAMRLLQPSKSSTAQGGVTRFDSEFDMAQLAYMEQKATRWLNALTSQNPNLLLASAQVPRQISLERIRRTEFQPTTPQDNGS